jgi:hypothetical protein
VAAAHWLWGSPCAEREKGPQLRLLETRSRGSPRHTHSQAKTDNRVVIYCPVRWFNFTSAGTLSLLGHNSPEEKDYLTRNAPLCMYAARRLSRRYFIMNCGVLCARVERKGNMCIAWLQSWINPKVRVARTPRACVEFSWFWHWQTSLRRVKSSTSKIDFSQKKDNTPEFSILLIPTSGYRFTSKD